MLYRINLVFLLFCAIILSNCSIEEELTFAKDVAPIIHGNCTTCHRPNGAAPFSLISFSDVRKKAKTIIKVTQDGFMPPWPADPNYSHFLNEKVLSETEKKTLKLWLQQGAAAGDTSILVAPDFSEKSQEPDMVLEFTEAIPIPGNNKDLFVAVKIPFVLPTDTFIKKIVFVPGNKKLVHHMNGHLIQFDDQLKQNVFEGVSYVIDDSLMPDDINKLMGLLQDDGSYPLLIPGITNYLPGMESISYPAGIGGGKISKKGAFYLRNMHYGPSAVDTSDQSKILLYFSDKAPKRKILETQMGTLGVSEIVPEFVIPPNEKKTFTSKLTVPNDVSILSINPHMHLLGTKFIAYTIIPTGDTIPMISIPKWDFRWQYTYTFSKPLILKKGSIIVVEASFDNTTSNPNQAFHPPKEIKPPLNTTNMKTTDEMLQLIINYLPYQRGDENLFLDKKD